MDFFLDTANLEDINKYKNFIDGVTTNPTILSQSNDSDCFQLIEKISSLMSGPVSCEVVSETYDEMLTEALTIAAISSNVCVKLPCTFDGLRVCKILSSKGKQTNLTLCFSVTQALLAAKCGATYVSPFVGRLEDIGINGLALIEEIVEVYNVQGFETRVLAASIRNIQHVIKSAILGAHAITMSTKILQQCFEHDLTAKGLAIFKADWNKKII